MNDNAIKEHVKNGGKFFTIKSIDTVRSCAGAKVIITTDDNTYYINKDRKSFHYNYPIGHYNLIRNPILIDYLMNRISIYVNKLADQYVKNKKLLIELQNNKK
jgi:hypothetical protein